eukprot:s701_g28.t1
MRISPEFIALYAFGTTRNSVASLIALCWMHEGDFPVDFLSPHLALLRVGAGLWCFSVSILFVTSDTSQPALLSSKRKRCVQLWKDLRGDDAGHWDSAQIQLRSNRFSIVVKQGLPGLGINFAKQKDLKMEDQQTTSIGYDEDLIEEQAESDRDGCRRRLPSNELIWNEIRDLMSLQKSIQLGEVSVALGRRYDGRTVRDEGVGMQSQFGNAFSSRL